MPNASSSVQAKTVLASKWTTSGKSMGNSKFGSSEAAKRSRSASPMLKKACWAAHSNKVH
eukprot:9298670-Alexandrium_andersonii.AAC.1